MSGLTLQMSCSNVRADNLPEADITSVGADITNVGADITNVGADITNVVLKC